MTSPIFVDIYEGDLHGHPNIDALVDAGLPWAGIGIKATEGTYYPRDPKWFQTYYPMIRASAQRAHRWGQNFFRFSYHYFRVDEDPVKQADFYCGLVDSAGGVDLGDLRAVVDVESSEQPKGISTQHVINAVSAFAARIKTNHGRAPILYGGSYIRDLGIKDHMGCAYLITAAYGSSLPARLYVNMGWSIDQLLGWQYQGTEGFTGPSGYPRVCPLGAGPLDLTAITICNGKTPDEQLAWIRADNQR